MPGATAALPILFELPNLTIDPSELAPADDRQPIEQACHAAHQGPPAGHVNPPPGTQHFDEAPAGDTPPNSAWWPQPVTPPDADASWEPAPMRHASAEAIGSAPSVEDDNFAQENPDGRQDADDPAAEPGGSIRSLSLAKTWIRRADSLIRLNPIASMSALALLLVSLAFAAGLALRPSDSVSHEPPMAEAVPDSLGEFSPPDHPSHDHLGKAPSASVAPMATTDLRPAQPESGTAPSAAQQIVDAAQALESDSIENALNRALSSDPAEASSQTSTPPSGSTSPGALGAPTSRQTNTPTWTTPSAADSPEAIVAYRTTESGPEAAESLPSESTPAPAGGSGFRYSNTPHAMGDLLGILDAWEAGASKPSN
ncbi:hypothetical protein FYK55_09295 [Roseiconus nitratireducens]|uniref:Uncharacterized protein n=1 Tax=Roseiconus nitratireducens TaxID=2605748 RepID=A0A5M6DAW0_9BACT|nr:hypothetical protein [Roseiconus nitratireducens]KAA5544513.1 hypothetical protein FYK55_09295 [Roseiconus nitratireducens]